MIQRAILTAVGADRPGLVNQVSQFIFEKGGSIEDSRMINLRGQFAIMMLVSGAEDPMARIQTGLNELAQHSKLHVELRPATEKQPATAPQALPYKLTASAMDQAGLVYRISHLLREMNTNIESMETTLAAAPITGAPLFEMEVILAVPRDLPIAQLRQAIASLCDQLNIDWQLTSL